MSNKLINVTELPESPIFDASYEISPDDLGYFTHSFFKYPCKFIPHIPRWAILKYTKTGDFVLDCFAGSGTSLVESVLLNRHALGVDFDNLSILLCDTKTVLMTHYHISKIESLLPSLFNYSKTQYLYTPDIRNLSYWFPTNNIFELSVLKSNIDKIKNKLIKNFLLICFASIIKKCSFADDNSPKPYISSRFPKIPSDVKKIYYSTVINNLKKYKSFNNTPFGKSKIISNDARNIDVKEYFRMVNLAITSPPYINAFDYVRSLRLENAWLGFYGDSNIIDIKRKQIGTEYLYSSIYNNHPDKSNISKLDNILKKLYNIDKKRAHVVSRFFSDMELNLISVNKLLKNNAHYVIVIGDSLIRNNIIPSHEIIVDIASQCGYTLSNRFSYLIKNRYLRIPRAGRGGFIKYDWILDFKKINSYG